MRQRRPLLGGPGTNLPFIVESFLSWMLALSCLLVSCWYYYCSPHTTASKQQQQQPRQLMTHCPRERLSVSRPQGLRHRIQQLLTLLRGLWLQQKEHERTLTVQEWILQVFQTDETARRLVSLIMTTTPRDLWRHQLENEQKRLRQHKQEGNGGNKNDDNDEDRIAWALLEHLEFWIWPRLQLQQQLPRLFQQDDDFPYKFQISVIVPCYQEDTTLVVSKLQRLFQTAQHPDSIEVLLVHVIDVVDKTATTDATTTTTASLSLYNHKRNDQTTITILEYKDGGGRGPTLNYGARHAHGRILTFLHADTVLTHNWDVAIQRAFDRKNNKTTSCCCCCCYCAAFSFAIDRNIQCNDSTDNKSSKPIRIPGWKAVETTANWRSQWFQLPYGDQCLSIPSCVFNFVGGYPDQCLMEDYELVQLLRRRQQHQQEQQHGQPPKSVCCCETNSSGRCRSIRILPQPVYCSPRRWESFGVLYVTFTNSRLVRMYNARVHATHNQHYHNNTTDIRIPADEDVFCQYYATDQAPTRKHPTKSPWEVTLETQLEQMAGTKSSSSSSSTLLAT
mmetsp:Transcript_29800/g.49409  ORF Transcript_29800/g.49409 Transcript_29800/m.49409 type:complete len:561 (-) Transcript_29800:372-2054(-)